MRWLTSRSRGQNTVEYLLMLAVIVGVVMVGGTLFKAQMPGFFNSIMEKIRVAAESLTRS